MFLEHQEYHKIAVSPFFALFSLECLICTWGPFVRFTVLLAFVSSPQINTNPVFKVRTVLDIPSHGVTNPPLSKQV